MNVVDVGFHASYASDSPAHEVDNCGLRSGCHSTGAGEEAREEITARFDLLNLLVGVVVERELVVGLLYAADALREAVRSRLPCRTGGDAASSGIVTSQVDVFSRGEHLNRWTDARGRRAAR